MNRLLACRVCLAYDTRLYSIMDGQFRDIYEKLVEATLDTKDMLPRSICYICFALMKKMLQFRDRSQKSNQILQHIISSGLELSVSSLDMLGKDQTGISWTLGISDIERTTTALGKVEFKVKIESVKSELDIEGTSDRDEDYSDSKPVCRDFSSDSEDDLPLQNKTDRVKIVETSNVILNKISGHEGTAPPEKRKLHENEAENELVKIQAPFIKTEKDNEPREKKEIQNWSTFNNTVTLNDTVNGNFCKNEYQFKNLLQSLNLNMHIGELSQKDSDINVTNECRSTNLLTLLQNNDNREENKFRDNTNQYRCQYCMKRFTDNAHLTRHLKVHTKGKPFKCDICQKGFSKKFNLTAHLRVHTKEKPFKCYICQKSFSEKGHLNRHLRVHTKEKPFKCYICQKGFSERRQLTRHLTVHTKVKPFKCDICQKGFPERGILTAHLRVHTGKTF